jgi:hypothetical protein
VTKTIEDIVKDLQAHTPPREVKYLPQAIDKENRTALALAYVDARFVEDRLDEACGPLGWQSKIEEIGGFLCVGIGIRNPETEEWLFKTDTGQDEPTDETDYEDKVDAVTVAGKSLVSRGLKRAGVQWGIARDLYDIPKRRRPIRLSASGKFAGWEQQGEGNGKAPAQVEGHAEGRLEGTGSAEPQAQAAQSKLDPAKYPPEYKQFMDLANQLGWDRDAINAVAQSVKDPQTGRVDYKRALELAQKQLPPAQA